MSVANGKGANNSFPNARIVRLIKMRNKDRHCGNGRASTGDILLNGGYIESGAPKLCDQLGFVGRALSQALRGMTLPLALPSNVLGIRLELTNQLIGTHGLGAWHRESA